MRTLKLTHDEIQLIENALYHIYMSGLDLSKFNILSIGESRSIKERSAKYLTLRDKIQNSDKDV